MPSINMPSMPAGSSPGTTHHDLLRCPRIDCPETFSEIQALINHTSVHFPPLKPRRFHHRFERGDWAKGTLERSQRARPRLRQKAKDIFNHILLWLSKGTNPRSQESNTQKDKSITTFELDSIQICEMPGPRDNPAVPGDSLLNGASSYRIITQLVPIRSYPSVRPDLREYAQTSPPGLLDGQEPSYRYLDKVYSLARKSEDEFRGHSEMPQPETPWPYLFTREIVLRFQQDFVGDLVEISTTVLEYMQIVVGVQPNLRFRNIILEIQPPHKILQSCLLALRGACSGSLATDKDALLLQYLAFIITPTIRGLPAEHARDLSRNGLSPANPKDSLAFHTCVRALDLVSHADMIHQRLCGYRSPMPSTSLGTHLVKSMLVDPVIDELEMDRDEVFIHGIMCGLDSNSSYDLYDIIVHIVLAGLTRFSQPQYTAYVKAVILHSHAFLTEQNPGLNKYNTEIIDRLMYTLQAAGDENIPMVIPPSLPRQSVDGQQNQDSTVEPGSGHGSGCL